MDFGQAFSFVFQDKKWLEKVAIAAGVCLIPYVGQITVLGWGLEITRRVIAGEEEVLPDWSNFSAHLTRGFQMFLVNLVYSLPILLIAFSGSIVPFFGLFTQDPEAAMVIISIISICFSCFLLLLGIITSFGLAAAAGNLAAKGELSAGFRFNEVIGLIKAAPGNYLLTVLAAMLVGAIIVPLGLIAFGIGVFFTYTYAWAVISHLYGQAYFITRKKQLSNPQEVME